MSILDDLIEARDGVKHILETETLSAEQREVVRLRDIEGYSYEEISEMLDIEIGTVKSRLNRARLNLKQMLAPVYSE